MKRARGSPRRVPEVQRRDLHEVPVCRYRDRGPGGHRFGPDHRARQDPLEEGRVGEEGCRPRPTARRIEEATPTEDADPSEKLSAAELEVAKRVYVGEIPCELGAKVSVKAMKREGYFFVTRGINRFVMHPVESRTGAIRLEDPRARRAVAAAWQQVHADEPEGRQAPRRRMPGPEQLKLAQEMKNRPPVNLRWSLLRPGAAARQAQLMRP